MDFCERPVVPTSLKPGNNPIKDNNWGAWGLQYMSVCSVFWVYRGTVPASTALPEGWGITRFPCTKLSPLDCFKEGGDFDYPEEMKLLERRVPDAAGTRNISLIDLMLGMYQMTKLPVKCVNLLRSNITSQFQSAGRPVAEVNSVQKFLTPSHHVYLLSEHLQFSSIPLIGSHLRYRSFLRLAVVFKFLRQKLAALQVTLLVWLDRLLPRL